jgi:transcriptional regulator with XRE-family HTH domain
MMISMTAPTTTRVLTPAALRARRLELGISAVRVADSLGVRLTEVGRWERGEVVPDAMRWRLLARMLHLDEEMPLWVEPRQPDPGEVDVVIDLIGADPFVSIVDRSGVIPRASTRRVARNRWRRTRLVAVLVLLGLALAWAAGNLGGAVADLVGAMTGR